PLDPGKTRQPPVRLDGGIDQAPSNIPPRLSPSGRRPRRPNYSTTPLQLALSCKPPGHPSRAVQGRAIGAGAPGRLASREGSPPEKRSSRLVPRSTPTRYVPPASSLRAGSPPLPRSKVRTTGRLAVIVRDSCAGTSPSRSSAT